MTLLQAGLGLRSVGRRQLCAIQVNLRYPSQCSAATFIASRAAAAKRANQLEPIVSSSRWQHTQAQFSLPTVQRCGHPRTFGYYRSVVTSGLITRSVSGVRLRSTKVGAKTSVDNTPPPLRERISPLKLWDVISRKGKGTSTFLKFVALAAPEKKTLAIGTVLLAISSVVWLSIPLVVGRLIDYFTGPNPPPIPFGLTQTQAFLLLIGAFSVAAFADFGVSFLMKFSGQRIVARLRQSIFARTLQQEVAFIEKGEGDAISRLSVDTSIVGESLTRRLSDGFDAVTTTAFGLGAMYYISPSLTTLMLVIVPPVSLGAVIYGQYLKRLSKRTQQAVGDMTNVATESLSALRTVKAFNAYTQEEAKFGKQVETILSLARREAIASSLFTGATGWSGNVTFLCLLGYGSTLVSQGAISMGDLTSLLLYTVYVGSGLEMMTRFFTSIVRGIGASERIFELLERKPSIDPSIGIPVPSSEGTIRFEAVSFAYPSRAQVEVLRDFSFELNMGDNVAIVGRSGSGKSSVHALLLRLYDPASGRITFNGTDIREFNPKSWRDLIGVVPQDPVLFTGTIAENIAFGQSDATLEQIKDAAKHANCDFIYDMPHGFDTKIGRLSLSGGQRQRVAIARALLKRPSILLMDEATSALDAVSEQKVTDAIDHILAARDTICVTVAHRLSTISKSDQVILLEGGRIMEQGNFKDLMAQDKSHFRILVAAQVDMSDADDAIIID